MCEKICFLTKFLYTNEINKIAFDNQFLKKFFWGVSSRCHTPLLKRDPFVGYRIQMKNMKRENIGLVFGLITKKCFF